jgi:predicted DNA binding CopG/RHH family protein
MKGRNEKYILESFDQGEWKSTKPTKSVLNKYRNAARATLAKTRRINIRISAHDLEGIQARALEEGIPYQTLISSILHKFVNGRLEDRRSH